MKQKAIIVDLDGTLCNCDHRLKYIDGSLGSKDWPNFFAEIKNDIPNEWCQKILIGIFYENDCCIEKIDKTKILFVTGRPENLRRKSVTWIKENVNYEIFDYSKLFMREDKDMRPDYEVKKDIFDKKIKDKYDVLFVLEDKEDVAKMWRGLGLTCLVCK